MPQASEQRGERDQLPLGIGRGVEAQVDLAGPGRQDDAQQAYGRRGSTGAGLPSTVACQSGYQFSATSR